MALSLGTFNIFFFQKISSHKLYGELNLKNLCHKNAFLKLQMKMFVQRTFQQYFMITLIRRKIIKERKSRISIGTTSISIHLLYLQSFSSSKIEILINFLRQKYPHQLCNETETSLIMIHSVIKIVSVSDQKKSIYSIHNKQYNLVFLELNSLFFQLEKYDAK